MSPEHRFTVASPQGCSCSLGELSQATRHRARLVQLARLHERLDQIGRNRERARIVHPFALEVLPDYAQALDRPAGLVCEQRRGPLCPQRPEQMPAGLRSLPRLRAPVPPSARPRPGDHDRRRAARGSAA